MILEGITYFSVLFLVGVNVFSWRTQAKADRDMQGVLDTLRDLGPRPIETLSPEEARRQPTAADAVVAYLIAKGKDESPEKVGNVENRSIPGPAGSIHIRIYAPEGSGPFPVIVYFHGGGFVIGDLDAYDATPRALVNAVQAVVVSAHYRQAPEHKFPAAHEDAFAAYSWTVANALAIGGDPDRIAVAGESAGGNLAAAVCLLARDRGAPLPLHQLLVYPVVDSNPETPSYVENADAKPLGKAAMGWFLWHAARPEDIDDPRLGLLRSAVLRGLPSATVITAEIDPLRSEGEAFAGKLRLSGVPVEYRNYDGVTHEFFGMGAAVAKAKGAVDFAAKNLRRALRG